MHEYEYFKRMIAMLAGYYTEESELMEEEIKDIDDKMKNFKYTELC